MRTLRAAVALAAALACCAACDTTPTPAPTASTPSAATPSLGATTAPATADATACTDAIDTSGLPTGYQSVLGAVALAVKPTLQTGSSAPGDPHRLFAKTGLLVHAGRAATISVAPDWRKRVLIYWGNHAAEWNNTMQTSACTAPAGAKGPWLVYPGGFLLDSPACVPVEVRSGGQEVAIAIPVGRPC